MIINNIVLVSGLNDYLVMNSKIENKPDTADYRVWAADATKILINLYKKYRNSVGSTEIKTWKRCWDVIAMDINTKVPHMKVSGSHVENRWRVLERNYRKYLNNQNKNGRLRKHFDYADEFDEIFGKKKNPYLLLIKTTSNASEQNGANLKTSRETATIQSEAKLIPIRQSQSIPAKTEKKETVTTLTENRQKCKMIRKRSTRSNILLNMRKDRLYYYKQRLEIEKTKMELVKEKVSIMKVKNLLIKERNDILSKFTKNTLFTEACS